MSKRKADNAVAPFVSSLWDMLSKPEHARYIAWTNNGENIKILDQEGFKNIVVPNYFNHRNIPSFVRQLNLYGFKKTQQDPNVLEFTHPCVKRGHPELLHQCLRQRKKPPAKRAKQGPQGSSSDKSSHGKKRSSSSEAKAAITTTADLAAQREALDSILHDMAKMQKQQNDLQANVDFLQQQNAQLRASYGSLHRKALASMQMQENVKKRLKRTFHFMLHLWERMRKEGGVLRMEDKSGASLLKDENVPNKSSEKSTPGASSQSSGPRPLQRLTSRESALFSDPGTKQTKSFEEVQSSLDMLGYLGQGSSPAVGHEDAAFSQEPQPLSRGISRQNSFVSSLMSNPSFSLSELDIDAMRDQQLVRYHFIC